MIRYLLDTDILSYIVKRRFPALNSRYLSLPATEVGISSITYAEILTGLEFVGPHHPMVAPTQAFLDQIVILDWPRDAAAPYAKIRQLTRKQPLAERDMLIAAHAMAMDIPLVTNNTKHFGRIGAPLRIENWLW